jgi:hypothetical protein
VLTTAISNLKRALILITFLATPLLSQTHATDHGIDNAVPLYPTAMTAIPAEANRPVYKPARCDAQGNIYFRGYQADDRRVPVVRADGQGRTVKYMLDADATLASGTSYDFSVLPNGGLYQPVQVGEHVYVVNFDQVGKIKGRVLLEKQFWIARLTALSDKSFLVIGTEPQPPGEGKPKPPPKTLIALFDEHGRLVRRINLNGDAREGTPPILAALSSDAQVDANGNVYLLLRTDPATVYVLDSGGRIERSFKVTSPAPKMNAVSMTVAKGRLAILFREMFRGMQHNDMAIITVVDASTGAEAARYSAGPGLGTTLACHSDDDFVFIGADRNNLAIRHAKAKN